jgi:hypothetical protein
MICGVDGEEADGTGAGEAEIDSGVGILCIYYKDNRQKKEHIAC